MASNWDSLESGPVFVHSLEHGVATFGSRYSVQPLETLFEYRNLCDLDGNVPSVKRGSVGVWRCLYIEY